MEDENLVRSTAAFEGVLFHAAGRGEGAGGVGAPTAPTTVPGWELTAADYPSGISVASDSLPDSLRAAPPRASHHAVKARLAIFALIIFVCLAVATDNYQPIGR